MPSSPARLTGFRLLALSLAALGGLLELVALWRARLMVQLTDIRRA